MAPLSTTIEVVRPAEDVFAYVTDLTRFAEWQEGVIDGRMEGEAPHAVGERCLTTRRIGGAERDVTSEVTHIDPPRTWGVQAIDGPIRANVDVTVEPVASNERSRLTIDLDFAGHGIGKLLVPLFVRRQAVKEMPVNLRRLKERMEAEI